MSDVTAVALGVDVGSSRVKAATAAADGAVTVVRFDDLPWLDSRVYVGGDGILSVGAVAQQRASHRPRGWVSDPMAQLTHDAVDVDGVRIDTADIVAALLSAVRSRVPNAAAAGRGAVRIVVPAGWGPRRRTALRAALDRVGMADAELIAAPLAVAWHLTAGGVDIPVGRCVLVCDFGAGFAASVVTRTPDGFETLATIHAQSVGGAAMDAAIAAALTAVPADPHVGSGADMAADSEVGAGSGSAVIGLPTAEALDRARLAKEALSVAPVVQVQVGTVPALFGVADLREAVGAVVAGAVDAARQAVAAADVTAEQVQWVVCVGGGARLPVIADALTAGLGVRPVMVTHAEAAAVFGAVQAPVATLPGESAAVSAAGTGGAAGVVLAAVGSIGLFGQFVVGAERYGPRQSIVPGMVLGHWGGLAFAAVLAVVATVAGASWLGTLRFEVVADDRLRHRLYAVALAGGAVLGAVVAAGYGVFGVGYFDVPAGPMLRWSVLAALPVVVAVLVAAGVVWWRPDPPSPGGSWPVWFRFPVAAVALVLAGATLIGYDGTGSPLMLDELRLWLERHTSTSNEIIGVTGRLGGAFVGAAVAVLVIRRVWLRVAVMLPLAGLTAVSLTWRTTGLIAVGFAAVVTWWWLWRAVSALAHTVLRPTAASTGSALRGLSGAADVASIGSRGAPPSILGSGPGLQAPSVWSTTTDERR
ncbi:hypothetical protein GCM10027610_071320 [Dactylosporangium cerinum]